MFGFLKSKAAEAGRQFSGRTDYLEAVCAAAALIASADGDIEDGEIKAATKAVTACKALQGFDPRAIEQTLERMLNRAAGGRVGRAALWDEIREVLKDPVMAESVVLAALDVAEGDGELEPAERTVLDRLAKEANVDLQRLLAA